MATGIRIYDFATLREGYAGATVTVYKANLTVPAAIFLDVDCTLPAPNPQLLTAETLQGLEFGRFAQPIYTNEAYYLSITGGSQTGVSRVPLFSLDNEDGSGLTVLPDGASKANTLSSILGRRVHALDYGPLDSVDAAANTTTLVAAIGAVASQGTGVVQLPPGIFPHNEIGLPAGVVLQGYGETATTLQCEEATAVWTVTGPGSGFAELTLDGVSLAANAVGIKMRGQQYIRLAYVTLKRFETGIDAAGAKFFDFKELSILNCVTNLKMHGDWTDGGGISTGNAATQYNRWIGGVCQQAATVGIDLSFEDSEVTGNLFKEILFDSNLLAISANGSRFTVFDECQFTNNTTVCDVHDDDALKVNNLIFGFTISKAAINTGILQFKDTCGDCKLVSCDLRGTSIKMITPKNPLMLIDCVEDAAATIDATGDGTKVLRRFSDLAGATKGVTTGSAATKAASIKLVPGEMMTARVSVTGKQRNGVDKASYMFTVTAQRAPSTLAYDAQTGNFALGQVLTGQTSGATGRIIADSDGGTTGTLTLHTISGIFVDNETIVDGAGGSALANGALAAGSVSILDQDIQSSSETDTTWDCAAAGSVEECEIRVTGASGKTIDWTVYMQPWRFG